MYRNILRCLVLVTLFWLPASAAFAGTYTIQKNDTLVNIAVKYGTSIEELQYRNDLSGDTIYPGQKLVVPDTTVAAGTAAQTGFTSYTVVPGDTLSLIGQKFGLPYQAIMQANNLNSWFLQAGQTLEIPTSAQASTTQTSRGGIDRSLSCNDADLNLLARLINAEAGGEPFDAQVCVGAVVINRTRSGCFPTTISGVIYDKDQFTPVLNGYINQMPTENAILAAKKALGGTDPTDGATYFYDNSAQSSFLRSLPVAKVVGHMIFAYAR